MRLQVRRGGGGEQRDRHREEDGASVQGEEFLVDDSPHSLIYVSTNDKDTFLSKGRNS